MELVDLIEAIKDQAKALASRMAAPPEMSAQEAFRKYADPDAILNSEAVQSGAGFAPIGIAGMFTGPLSRLTTTKQILDAADAAKSGLSPDKVWQQLLMGRNPIDNKLRSEISDVGSRLLTMPEKGEALPASLMLMHPGGLFDAYPHLQDLPVIRGAPGASYFMPETKGTSTHIAISPSSPNPLSSMLHELQHAIQSFEGFGMGGSPRNPAVLQLAEKSGLDPVDVYRALPGELEARNTQARQFLDVPGRKLLPPWVTQETSPMFGGKSIAEWLAAALGGSK